jgi:hypothetical protein
MNTIAMQRRLAYQLQRLGRVGLLGAGLLLLAVLAGVLLLRVGEHEISANRQRLQALQQQETTRSQLPVNSALEREEQLRIFYSGFAPARQLPETLKRIYQAADKQGLTLESGEYQRLQSGSERLQRYQVTLPVQGSFKQVLGMLDSVLLENHTVALENVSFKREKVDDETVEAKVVLLVFLDGKP